MSHNLVQTSPFYTSPFWRIPGNFEDVARKTHRKPQILRETRNGLSRLVCPFYFCPVIVCPKMSAFRLEMPGCRPLTLPSMEFGKRSSVKEWQKGDEKSDKPPAFCVDFVAGFSSFLWRRHAQKSPPFFYNKIPDMLLTDWPGQQLATGKYGCRQVRVYDRVSSRQMPDTLLADWPVQHLATGKYGCRQTGVSRRVRPTTQERSLNKRELEIPCFDLQSPSPLKVWDTPVLYAPPLPLSKMTEWPNASKSHQIPFFAKLLSRDPVLWFCFFRVTKNKET